MENAVLGSILENLKAINIVTDETVSVFKSDRANTADSREYTVTQFISRYLPSDFHIRNQSPIYSQDSFSKNIDCVVLAPNHPLLITPQRAIALAEGVYAAVEVKPDISTLSDNSELIRGLLQLKSVKNLDRRIDSLTTSDILKSIPTPNYFHKIPTVLFCFKSTNLSNTIHFIINKMLDGTLNNDEIPDIIVALDKGVIFYTPHISSNILGPHISKENLRLFKSEEVFIYYESKKQEEILALFLLLFLTFTPPTMLSHKFIIKEYLSNAIKIDQMSIIPLKFNYETIDELSFKNYIDLIKKNNPEAIVDEDAIKKMFIEFRKKHPGK